MADEDTSRWGLRTDRIAAALVIAFALTWGLAIAVGVQIGVGATIIAGLVGFVAVTAVYHNYITTYRTTDEGA